MKTKYFEKPFFHFPNTRFKEASKFLLEMSDTTKQFEIFSTIDPIILTMADSSWKMLSGSFIVGIDFLSVFKLLERVNIIHTALEMATMTEGKRGWWMSIFLCYHLQSQRKMWSTDLWKDPSKNREQHFVYLWIELQGKIAVLLYFKSFSVALKIILENMFPSYRHLNFLWC